MAEFFLKCFNGLNYTDCQANEVRLEKDFLRELCKLAAIRGEFCNRNRCSGDWWIEYIT